MSVAANWRLFIWMAGLTAMILAIGKALEWSDGGKGMIKFAGGFAIMVTSLVVAGLLIEGTAGTIGLAMGIMGGIIAGIALSVGVMLAAMAAAEPAIEKFTEVFMRMLQPDVLSRMASFGLGLGTIGIGMRLMSPAMKPFAIGLAAIGLVLTGLQVVGVLDSFARIAEGLGMMFENASEIGPAVSGLASLVPVLENLGEHSGTILILAAAFGVLAEASDDVGTALDALAEISNLKKDVVLEYKLMLQAASEAATTPVMPGSSLKHMSNMFEQMTDIVDSLEKGIGDLTKATGKKETTVINTSVEVDGREIARATHEHLAEFD